MPSMRTLFARLSAAAGHVSSQTVVGVSAFESARRPRFLIRAWSTKHSMLTRPLRPLIGRQHALGHEVIDLDHKAIADWWFRAAGCEQIQFPFFVARLKRLLSSHFDHEAELMQQAGGELCGCHRREHQTLLDLCDQAAAESRQNWRRTQALIRGRFPKLVRDHIVSMDQSVVLFINTTGPTAQT